MVAAGSGVVPFMGMIRYQRERGTAVPMHLLFSSKAEEFVIYRSELEAMVASTSWLEVSHTFTRDPTSATPRFNRRIDKEMVSEIFAEVGPKLAYVCGPPEMVDDVERALLEGGMDSASIKTEKYD